MKPHFYFQELAKRIKKEPKVLKEISELARQALEHYHSEVKYPKTRKFTRKDIDSLWYDYQELQKTIKALRKDLSKKSYIPLKATAGDEEFTKEDIEYFISMIKEDVKYQKYLETLPERDLKIALQKRPIHKLALEIMAKNIQVSPATLKDLFSKA